MISSSSATGNRADQASRAPGPWRPGAMAAVGRRVLRAAAGAAILFAAGADAAESNYCVAPVPLVRANNNDQRAAAPSGIHLPPGARFPVVFSYGFKPPDGRGYNFGGTLLWHPGADHELFGPYQVGFAFWGVPQGRSDAVFAIGGRYREAGWDDHWQETRLLRQRLDGAFVEIEPGLQRRLGEPYNIAWSDLLGGLLVESVDWKDQDRASTGRPLREGSHKISLLKDGILTTLQSPGYFTDAADLPGLGVVGLLGHGSLSFVTPRLEVMKVTNLTNRHGWWALHETADSGWLYAIGVDDDYAVHVEQLNGAWHATTITHVMKQEASISDLFARLFGSDRAKSDDDQIAKVVRMDPCRRFNRVTRRIMTCDGRYELRRGEVERLAGGRVAIGEHLGDANGLGVTLLLGNDRLVYGYDGEALRAIVKVGFDFALVSDIPELERAYLATTRGLFELRRTGGQFELIELAAPQVERPVQTRFGLAPDGAAALAFAYNGIFMVKDRAITPIWLSGEQSVPDVFSGMGPTYVETWGGTLFATSPLIEGHFADETHIHLLTRCASSNK